MPPDTVAYVLELVGILAFATSGALLAIRCRFDVVGIVVLAETTALGGGVLRDVLLYEPTAGGLRLVGLEWMQPDADQDLTTDDDRPTLEGLPFEGPMPGHEPGMPVHYDKHLYLWKTNPEGAFAVINPRVTC